MEWVEQWNADAFNDSQSEISQAAASLKEKALMFMWQVDDRHSPLNVRDNLMIPNHFSLIGLVCSTTEYYYYSVDFRTYSKTASFLMKTLCTIRQQIFQWQRIQQPEVTMPSQADTKKTQTCPVFII